MAHSLIRIIDNESQEAYLTFRLTQQYMSAISSNVCKASIGMQTLIGYDTLSAFAVKKSHVYGRFWWKNNTIRKYFRQVRDSWAVPQEMQAVMEKLVCLLYTPKPATPGVRQLRYNLFCSRNEEYESHQLPQWRFTRKTCTKDQFPSSNIEEDPSVTYMHVKAVL